MLAAFRTLSQRVSPVIATSARLLPRACATYVPQFKKTEAPQTYNVTINGQKHTIEGGNHKSIVSACRDAGVYVPVLCYHPNLSVEGSCRVCQVEVNGTLRKACTNALIDGSEIVTNSSRVNDAVQKRLAKIRSDYPTHQDCASCPANGSCELQDLFHKYNVTAAVSPQSRANLRENEKNQDDITSALSRKDHKCIRCGRCVRVCAEIQDLSVLEDAAEWMNKHISTPDGKPLDKTRCIECGQCSLYCPTAAIRANPHVESVRNNMTSMPGEKRKVMVATTAPSVRVAVCEAFGLPSGALSPGKLVAALRQLGFDYVFDVNFGADFTTVEEASELVRRIQNGGPFPMFTSCCPAWVNLVEKLHPEVLPQLSSCKSPQGMLASLTKTYFADKIEANPEDIDITFIAPCTAKKAESEREELTMKSSTGETIPETDHVLTAREIAAMIKMDRINYADLEESEYDNPLANGSGSGAIFGTSGGVMEAALRSANVIMTGEELKDVEITEVRNGHLDGVKEAVVEIAGKELRVAVASGASVLQKLVLRAKDGLQDYHFIEMMACPGGCVGGGGMPTPESSSTIADRMEALRAIDRDSTSRTSLLNPDLITVYNEHMEGKLFSDKAHELLHTTHRRR